MMINPHQTTAPIGELATRRADQSAAEGLRRARAAAPPARPERVARAENLAGADGQNVPEDDSKVLEPATRQLAIRKDPEIDRVVVQVLDAKTGEVVRQIPSEEWVRHLKRLKGAKGLFVDQKG